MSSTASASTTISKPPRTPLKAAPTATLSPKAILTGTHTITLSPRCIVHPFARLDSVHAPTSIGEAAVVWEGARVGFLLSEGASSSGPASKDATTDEAAAGNAQAEQDQSTVTVLETRASVQAQAVVEAGARIGASAVVEVGARVGPGAVVGEYAKIGAGVHVAPGEVVPPFTIIYADEDSGVVTGMSIAAEGGEHELVATGRRVNHTLKGYPKVREMQDQGHERHIELLRKLIKSAN